MRDKISVLYYPDFWIDFTTLQKAILLFDELHFIDRPAIMFGSQFGLVGCASPLRQYEQSFRKEGVPFYVHGAPQGPISDEWYEQIRADVNDLQFLQNFQNGLKNSRTFRDLQIQFGNYGEYGDEKDVAKKMFAVDLSRDLRTHESPMALFEDSSIRCFDLSTPTGSAKQLVTEAISCSAKLNFALDAGVKKGFFPLADATPYKDLLAAKYGRAMGAIKSAENKIPISDLSFAIFDELISGDRLKKLKMSEVIGYRKKSEKAREEFLEHLSLLQIKQAGIGVSEDYVGAINRLINTEIKPAVQEFKNKLQTIDESLFGTIAKGAISAIGGGSAITIFGGLSWPGIAALAMAASAYVATATIDAILAERAIHRECSLSYLLALD
jgi:hypothetical protein